MATLLLAGLGGAIGGSIGGSVLGVSAVALGQAVGSVVGRSIDQRLIGGLSPTRTEGPRLENLDVMTSREGNALPKIDGRAAISGEVIWAAKIRETSQVDRRKVGSGKQKQTVKETTYSYTASFAISLGAGPMRHLGRIWANGQPVDLTDMIEEGRVRFYPGSEDQMPDPMIDGIEGGAPAYRGTAYLVFEDLPLDDWGNAIPQIKAEAWGESGEMEDLVRGVNIIPGSTEWGYMPTPVKDLLREDSSQIVNAARHDGVSDWKVAMDQLGGLLPSADTASLVVAWFGTDLRAGQCEIEPRVESKDKDTEPEWWVSGRDRDAANATTQTVDGRPAYGSTPADLSVVRAIKDLRERGKRVVLYPFIMMDVPADNDLPDPVADPFPMPESGTRLATRYEKPDIIYGGQAEPARFPRPTSYAHNNPNSELSGDLWSFTTFSVGDVIVSYDIPLGNFGLSADDVDGGNVPLSYIGSRLQPHVGTRVRVRLTALGEGARAGQPGDPIPDAVIAFESEPSPGSFFSTFSHADILRPGTRWLRFTLEVGGQFSSVSSVLRINGIDASSFAIPTGQGAYPWRGRIAPHRGEDVQTEVDAFMGSASASNFQVEGESISYSGPTEWRFRRFILHLASLAKAAGGVDAFLIGTEMRGMSMTPADDGSYPFVTALKTLAAEVRSILPDAKISYAADWSEYHSHQDSGDLRFHLDPLWADPNIDFVGIDNYLPLSDWRAGRDHADFDDARGHTTPYSLDYLKGNIEGGEYWDWFYASEADRTAQVRTPITDGAHGEPWVFRQKAIRDWHANAHHERIGGVRSGTSTSWVPGSKPVWFTELGCPAVDFGANRPNVFSAANSSEGSLPWFSVGVRDDYMQRQFLRASLEWWRDNGGAAVDIADVQVWCWDARPWPEYPRHESIWADGPDWFLGHWLNGRAGAAPAAEVLARRLTAAHGLTADDFDLSGCHGQADGYPSAAPIGFRDFMQPLEIGLGLQAHERNGKLVVETRASAPSVMEVDVDAMVDTAEGSPFVAKRGALEDVAGSAVMRFSDGLGDYEQVSTRAVIGAGTEAGVSTVDSPLVLDFDRGSAASERLLRAAADGRDSLTFRLPRSAVAVRPGVILPVRLGPGLPARSMMVERVVEGEDRQIEARSFNPGAFAPTGGVFRPPQAVAVRGSTLVTARFLDLPILPGSTAEEWDTLVALSADPWPGGSLAKSSNGNSFEAAQSIPFRSLSGVTLTPLHGGRPATWFNGHVDVELSGGTLVTLTDEEVLDGANGLAIQHPGGWEVLQFVSAELIGPRTFRLSRMLRGQVGTEFLAGDTLPEGATVVALDESLTPLGLDEREVGLGRFYRFGSARTDVGEHAVREHTGTAVGRRPYAPAHLRVDRSGGDIALTWMRRTRIDGEADWRDGVASPPLGEATESYAVEVVQNGEVRRSATVSAPQYDYPATDQAGDGVTEPFTIRVAQVSDTFGPGSWVSVDIS
ncbi:MAG: glycoside hydrolase TIM-barrel-like domain-containing protein [Pseudomonadota bacterium]